MRRALPQREARTPAGSIGWSTVCVVLLFIGLVPAAAVAQYATYAEQLGYYYGNDGQSALAASSVGTAQDMPYFSAEYPSYSPPQANSPSHPAVYVGNYGSVSFSTPGGYLVGFRDYLQSLDDVAARSVIVGDPSSGSLAIVTDFDDLHAFNIGFDELGVRRGAGWRSFDVGAVYWLLDEHAENATADDFVAAKTLASLETLNDAHGQSLGPSAGSTAIPMPPRWAVVPQFSRFAADRKVSGIGFIYGYNEMAIRSGFEFIGRSGILGRTDSDTEAINWIHGPQAGLVAYRRWGPISLYGHAIALAGLNDTDIHQENNIGQELIPGATNRLLYSQPTHSEHDESYLEFTPTGLFWAEVGLHVTERASLKFAWSAVYAYNAMLAEDRVRYYLPDMGLIDPAVQHLFEQYFYCGVEVVR